VRGHRDLRRTCVAAIACALVAILAPWELVRLIAALPLAVFLPGYAIVSAAFAPYRLDPQRLLMLTLACGLSTLCVGGLLLDFLPGGGLRTGTWAVLLVLVTVGAARFAALRRSRPRKPKPRRRLRLRPVDALGVVLAAALAIGALALASTPLPAENAVGYTALWLLPEQEATDSIEVGVTSAEQGPQEYRLRVRAGEEGNVESYRLALDPGEERVFRVPVEVEASGPTRVAASLYREDDPGALYRRVTTWLQPGEGR
jgi:Protein of unknown function (DUF1616)